jgi:hypothetical protein
VCACSYLYSGHFSAAVNRPSASVELKNRLIDEAYVLLEDTRNVFVQEEGNDKGQGKNKSKGKDFGKSKGKDWSMVKGKDFSKGKVPAPPA